MIMIRQTHNYGFRSGDWAHLFSIQHDKEGRDVWVVEFPDGAKDAWPSWDAMAGYEVKVDINEVELPTERTIDDQSTQTSTASADFLRKVRAVAEGRREDSQSHR